MVFRSLVIKNLTIDPPLFGAPMAGVTHSAFRRLLADFGGYGALFTEMLSGKALIHEKVGQTPFTKIRREEGTVWFQVVLSGDENVEKIIEKIKVVNPEALDINAACPAPEMTAQGCGAALFRDQDRFAKTLAKIRRLWNGALTVKCRLGDETSRWQETFAERLKIMGSEGIDAVVVHPRFFKEKLKREARGELFSWIASKTSMPIIANGDIVSRKQLDEKKDLLAPVSGLMIGRMAVVKPWIFRELAGKFVAIDYMKTWSDFYRYVLEDFPREKAMGRIKEFSKYFAQNFFFGHEFYRAVQTASSLEILYENAMRFLSSNPKLTTQPTVRGL